MPDSENNQCEMKDATPTHSSTSRRLEARQNSTAWLQKDICDVCDACLHGRSERIEVDSEEEVAYVHHRTVASMEAAIRGGCQFCVSMWTSDEGQLMVDQETQYNFQTVEQALGYNVPQRQGVTRWFVNETGMRISLQSPPHHWTRLDLIQPTLSSGLKINTPGLWTGLSTNSAASIDMLSLWLRDCQLHHPGCGAEPSWYPTRLVHLGLSGDFSVIESSTTTVHGPYCTLSYCWGDRKDRLLLTRHTKARLEAGATLLELPKLLQDAAQVCLALGVRYLWIDSLCISQDDDLEDWKRESQLMHKVYSNGHFNISAMASSTPDEGLFRKRRLQAQAIVRHATDWFQPGVYSMKPGYSYKHDVDRHAPLESRGWVLQERLLSSRNIHFGPYEILWECNSIMASESCPQGCHQKLVTGPGNSSLALPRVPLRGPNAMCELSNHEMRKRWQTIQEQYSGRRVSYVSDKPVAIAGLVKVFENLLNDRYVYGLWADSFCAGLQWMPDLTLGPGTEPEAASVPSWSWLSTGYSHTTEGGLGTQRFTVVESEAELCGLAGKPSPPRVHLKGYMGSTKIFPCAIPHYREDDRFPKRRVSVNIGDMPCDLVELDRPDESHKVIHSGESGYQGYYMLAEQFAQEWDDDRRPHLSFFLFQCEESRGNAGNPVFRRLAMGSTPGLNPEEVAQLLQAQADALEIPCDSYDEETGQHVICLA